MAMKTRYTVIEGEVMSELRAGTKRDYVPNPQGSTIALLNSSTTKTDTFDYWPYGEISGRSGTTSTPLKFVGTIGYYSDSDYMNYVRLRYVNTSIGRWIVEDPIGFAGGINKFRYCHGNPVSYIDPSGAKVVWIENPVWGGKFPSSWLCGIYSHAYIYFDKGCDGEKYWGFFGGGGGIWTGLRPGIVENSYGSHDYPNSGTALLWNSDPQFECNMCNCVKESRRNPLSNAV
jgi:RHS repeat-associated protein